MNINKTISSLILASLFLLCTACRTSDFSSPAVTPVPTEKTPLPEPTLSADEIADENFSSLSNVGSGWGFKKIKGSEPDIPSKYTELFKKYNTFYIDTKREKNLYLTFDEGYENGYTAQILDTLKKYEIPAAFFITGPYLEREAELVRRMVSEGHIVGNHTVHHPNLHKLVSAEKIAEELCSLNEKYMVMFGKSMKYMRPPEGEYSERVLAVADSLGYKTVFWSFAYKDWDPSRQSGASHAFEEVTPYLHNGAILLLHAVSSDNAEALEDIIQYALNNGYKFNSLDELSYNT